MTATISEITNSTNASLSTGNNIISSIGGLLNMTSNPVDCE